MQHKITQKEQKETIKKGGISLTIMGQRQTYNSIHKPHRSPNEMLGFDQDDHPYRMCNETRIPKFRELQIPGIPMVMMVMSHARSVHEATRPNLLLMDIKQDNLLKQSTQDLFPSRVDVLQMLLSALN